MTSSSTAPVTTRSGFARAAGWSYVMDGGRQAISLLVTFVLAAILGPEIFGLAAMATMYVLLIDLIQRQGMAAAVIQRKHLSRSHKDTAFWLVLAVSVVMTGVSVAGAPLWAAVNRTPELATVTRALSPLVLIQGLTTVQEALLRREMAFKVLAKRTLTAVLAGGAIGLVGAVAGWGVYALVAQQLVFATVSVVMLWSASSWRPRLHLSRGSARDLLGFSTGSFLTSVAVFVNNRADALLIGIFFGPTVVGVYRLGSRLIDAIITGLAGPIRSLALPELSPHQDSAAELATRSERLLRLSGLAVLPVLGVVAACAEPLTRVLGGAWSGAAPVIQALCVVGAVRAIATIDGPLLQAVGSPFVQAGISAVAAGISAATFVAAGFLLAEVSADGQALGVAVARAGLYGSMICLIHVLVVRRYAGIGPLRGLSLFLAPLAAAVAAFGAGWLIAGPVRAIPPLPALIVVGVVSTGVGLTVLWRLVPDARGIVQALKRRPVRPGRKLSAEVS